MDNEDMKPAFETKEQFIAEVKSLVAEGEELVKKMYDYGLRMAKAGMLSSGAADAYIGMKATVEILKGLEDGSVFDQLEQKAAEHEISKYTEDASKYGKYLN